MKGRSRDDMIATHTTISGESQPPADTRAMPADREFTELVARVYDELRDLAGKMFRRERADHTLQPTALVHEVFMRLQGAGTDYADRAHFVATAARAMRHVLVNHAIHRNTAKRGGRWSRVEMDDAVELFEQPSLDLAALDDALIELESFDPRQARLVELRFFGGLTVSECAQALGVSQRTTEREWALARAWLHTRVAASRDS